MYPHLFSFIIHIIDAIAQNKKKNDFVCIYFLKSVQNVAEVMKNERGRKETYFQNHKSSAIFP